MQAADTTADIKQTIYVDGHPAGHVLVSLYSCKDGSRSAGPVATTDDGSVTFSKVSTGDYCERAEQRVGYSFKQVHIDTAIQNQRVDITEFVPSTNWDDRLIPFVFCILTVLLVIYPIVRYLLNAWAFRRDALIGQLSGDSMRLYYQQFRSGEKVPWLSGKQTKQKKAEMKPVGDSALLSSELCGRLHPPVRGVVRKALLRYPSDRPDDSFRRLRALGLLQPHIVDQR
jgi:hypothetical protein